MPLVRVGVPPPEMLALVAWCCHGAAVAARGSRGRNVSQHKWLAMTEVEAGGAGSWDRHWLWALNAGRCSGVPSTSVEC